jgi:hypothetical protein
METKGAEKEDLLEGLSRKDKIRFLQGLDRLQLDVEQELGSEEIEPVEAEEDLRSIERIRARLLKKGESNSSSST